MPSSPAKNLIAIRCPKCATTFKVHGQFAGKVGVCPNPECGTKYRVPQRAAETPPPIRKKKPSERKPTSSSRPIAGKPARSKKRTLLIATWAAAFVCVVVIAGAVVLQTGSPAASTAEAETPDPAASQQSSPRKLTPEEMARERKARRAIAMKEFHGFVQPFLKKYCYECHGPDEQTVGLGFHKWTDEKTVYAARPQWEKVLRVVKAGAMPPKEHTEHPTGKERIAVAKWIDKSIFDINCSLIDDPGRVTIRRLNRSEYNNTVRDLVGVDFNPAKDFPSDDVGYGFDNIGDVLSLPPLLMEKYLDAAEQIAVKAIILTDLSKFSQRKDGRKLNATGKERGFEGNARKLVGLDEAFTDFSFFRAGEYNIRVQASARQLGNEVAKMEVWLDGDKLKTVSVTGKRRKQYYEFKVNITKSGGRRIAVGFANPSGSGKNRRTLFVHTIEVRGPLGDSLNAHRRLMIARPGNGKSANKAATEILAKFLPRAFRRPVTPDEIAKYVRLVEYAMKHGESFNKAMQIALQGVLVSPHFLFRIETDREPGNPDAKRKLNDYELATRLSYFLWSSMPDDELFQLASEKKLHDPAVLKRQVQRMLQDPKSESLVKNFAAQWLNLRILDEVTPDRKQFRTFDGKLRRDMRRETELFFTAIMRENRSILDFLDGRFTFLNERLAKHYGIPGIKGEKLRRVVLTGNQRAGVLTHASILTITSNPTRTSPVKRGKWILENIFDAPPPPPPPNVPELDEKKIAAGNLSLRQQFEIHRKNPVCASCHDQMDALGFGFENFDAVGQWRTKDGKVPVDASGKLPDGSSFNGPLPLVKLLKNRKTDFTKCLTKKLMTFALGRGLEYYDKCKIDEIAAKVEKDNHRFVTIVEEIVLSEPFQMRRGDGEKP